jgi:hypothetical protein
VHQEKLAQIRETNEIISAKVNARTSIIGLRERLADIKQSAAESKAKAAQAKASGGGKPVAQPEIDFTSLQTEVENAIAQMEADLAALDGDAQTTHGAGEMTGAQQQQTLDATMGAFGAPTMGPQQSGEQIPQWILDLPPGTVFTAPDGTKRVR